MSTAPRIFCIPATAAPAVAVLRRGPTNWSHVGRWNTEEGTYEPGSWLRGRLFPRRSDLSPDGRYLSYFAHQPSARWSHRDTYVAVSRLPWLTALYAFGTDGTWTGGFAFTGDAERGLATVTLPNGLGLRPIRAEQFANERRGGWVESPDSPPRAPGDAWDEQRAARIRKPQPGGHLVLYAANWRHGRPAIDGIAAVYWLESEAGMTALDDLQWADWDARGRLLAATTAGCLQIREVTADGFRIAFEQDLAALTPCPTRSPDWAREW